MKNGYFQLVCGATETALKIFDPEVGGKPVNIKEVMEYLTRHSIDFDAARLNKEIQAFNLSSAGEYQIKLNENPSMEVRESYVLHIREDKLMASARFYPPSLKGEKMTFEEFLGDLSQKNIRFGIQTEGLKKFFAKPFYCREFLVAKGEEPRQGEDARIEYYFETDLRAKPTLKEDGSVDFFNLNTVNHCGKGEVLARLIPGDPGDPGKTIFNELVKPREIKRLTLKYGRNIILSEDHLVLTSEVDGHVTLVDDKVFVSNVLEVENVDNSTGNIDYDGSVKINGNVCTNFSVKAKGNIEVSGVVEGAYLEAGENIIIARGMNGMSRGVLKATGNVISKFIENSKVSAGGDVSTDSILHSEVLAGTDITVDGRRGFITGGRVCAANCVKVKNLGSSMGADTVVEVGAPPEMKQRIAELQKQITENKKQIEVNHPVLVATAQKLAKGVQFKPEQMKYFQEMLQNEKQLKQEQAEMIKEMDEIQTILDRGSLQRRQDLYCRCFHGSKKQCKIL